MLVIFGGVFDLLDGRVARMTNRFTEFGVQLDSIADVLGFGLAPALIAWTWALKDLGAVGVAVTFWYVLCAAFRLARFNVGANDNSWPLYGHAQGLDRHDGGAARSSPSCGWRTGTSRTRHVTAPGSCVAGRPPRLPDNQRHPFAALQGTAAEPAARRILAVARRLPLGAVVLDPSMWWGIGAALYLTSAWWTA